MISFYRSAGVAPGKNASALLFAREVVAYIKETVGIEVHIAVPVGGNPNRIGFAVRYENLSALEATQVKLTSDSKYMELTAKGAENFVAGSFHDEIWRVL
jgi:hypothetical protein